MESKNIQSIETSEKGFNTLLDDSQLLQKLASLEFKIPTPVQNRAIPLALAGKDLLIQGATGSGKTLAFSIPLICHLKKKHKEKKTTICLVCTPTRELALQVCKVIKDLDELIDPVCAIGGKDISKQEKALKKDPRVVISTPGRLLDLMRRKIVSLKDCSFFVLDEADEMLSMGFIDDVRSILTKLPDKRQGILVSATITSYVKMLSESFLTSPENILLKLTEDQDPSIEHYYINVPSKVMAKPNLVCDIIETWRPRTSIIFCNTKSDTRLVEVFLRRRGFVARRLNSDLSQEQRDKVMRKIREGELPILVATDIAARGIDLDQLDLVIHFSIHEQPEVYIHRTGRTGRAGKHGKAIALISPTDFGYFHHITKILDVDFKKMEPPLTKEIASARLAHLHEILKESSLKLDEPDQALASLLVNKMNVDPDALSKELLEIIAQLSCNVLQHHVQQEAESLDEELQNKYLLSLKNAKETTKQIESTKSLKNTQTKRNKHSEFCPYIPENSTARVFLNRGRLHGMTEREIESILYKKAEIQKRFIKRIFLRNGFSFVDLASRDAQKLLKAFPHSQDNSKNIEATLAMVVKRSKSYKNTESRPILST